MSITETMEGYDIEQPIPTSVVDQNKNDVETSIRHGKLYVAAQKGEWDEAKKIFMDYPSDVKAEITVRGDTVLHVAAAEGKNYFVEELMKSDYMNEINLEKRNKGGHTAFVFAAMSGNTKLAKLMLDKNENLAMIRWGNNSKGMLPVLSAAVLGHKEMVKYLYRATKNQDNFTDDDRIELLVKLIEIDLYDVAQSMVMDFPVLAVSRVKVDQKENGETDELGETALHALARKPSTFNDFDKSKLGILKRYFYKLSGANMMKNKTMHPDALKLVELLWKYIVNQLDFVEILKLISNPRELIFDAAKEGNIGFLSILARTYPDLMFSVNDEMYSIFHTAVLYRHENIFALIHGKPSMKGVVAMKVGDDDNNILHLAGMLPPDLNRLKVVSGAAIQMQRELWWFQEVSKLMPPIYPEPKNKRGETARTLFTESHKDLMKEGEKWMKTTANSCMLVATLIATVVFAAAFTVPGSVKDDTGTPNFIKKASFITFAIFDAISLVSSASSILTFLAILTARYAEEQFLWFLPTMLLFGLSTLLISITGMMGVFCTTLFIVFKEGTKVPAILAIALACIPVIQFILQQILLIQDVCGLIS